MLGCGIIVDFAGILRSFCSGSVGNLRSFCGRVSMQKKVWFETTFGTELSFGWRQSGSKGIYAEKYVYWNHFYGGKVVPKGRKFCIDTPTNK